MGNVNVLSPIVLFVYRRPFHTQQVLDSLAANEFAERSVLHIYCDGPKEDASADDVRDIEEVRRIVRAELRFERTVVIESATNLGLANSIVRGVTEVIERYGTAIVVEDDLIVSPQFLGYMNDSLRRYADEPRVGQIGACNFFACGPRYPRFFFVPIPDCWGWATWADRWRHFEPNADLLLTRLRQANLMHRFNVYGAYPMSRMLRNQIKGKVDSWAIRWQAVCVLNGWHVLYPNPAMSNHVESYNNTHTSQSIRPPLQMQQEGYESVAVDTNAAVIRALKRGYAGISKSDGTLNLRAGHLLLRWALRQSVPEGLLSRLAGRPPSITD